MQKLFIYLLLFLTREENKCDGNDHYLIELKKKKNFYAKNKIYVGRLYYYLNWLES